MGNVLSRSFKLQQQQGVMLCIHSDVCDNLKMPKLDLYPDMHRSIGVRLSFHKVSESKLIERLKKVHA
jgi:hypothetical protein